MPTTASPPKRWPVHVINMAANVTRMARAAEHLRRAGVSFDRFEAVDGRALGPEALARVYDPVANAQRFRHALIAPEIGCYLSHLALWERLAASDAPGFVILEDDLAAADDLGAVLDALAAEPANGWDMAKLFSLDPAPRMLETRPLLPGRSIGRPWRIPSTTLGYAIRREAAARLAAQALPMARPIDEDHKFFWEHGLTIVLVTPPPLRIGEEAAEAGTIRAARKRATRLTLRGLAPRAWRTLRYRLGYLARLWLHRALGR
ncbi:MAG: glycosyltransferase family 25 protein [Rhodobacteraceae bacterium]|nr:glycosyltransferase family 25 protein [Paracoccaceae bacterium]